MLVPSLALAVAGAALLVPATLPPAHPQERRQGVVRAADLLAKARDCLRISHGRYRSDRGAPADISVCGARGAVFWTADMDIDCDGRPGIRCNSRTDPYFSPATTYRQSDGRYPSAETLPYLVVPGASSIWDHRAYGIGGGSVAAVVHGSRIVYTVVADTGPKDVIGEASYATARALGINADPRTGGTDGPVTYIVFRGSRAVPLENHRVAVSQGQELLRRFLAEN
ncbi:glycoside hydrolase family 75 protein [Streptomyces glomeratus]|uniref:Fungal chitosanase n=1 Tax=Streptomyces glomeratus TaxID=284452 RepID=A0ABP6LLF1_9ACTN|nr:glycoside hydrolase family 75 protein [Streptomyces glomeratus]MCF1509270.1 glycoside hydrolase family 75 protein [Streptomyces glomeratus]